MKTLLLASTASLLLAGAAMAQEVQPPADDVPPAPVDQTQPVEPQDPTLDPNAVPVEPAPDAWAAPAPADDQTQADEADDEDEDDATFDPNAPAEPEA